MILLPEFDAPAHVGEGWQLKNVTSCFNYQPWAKYCVEPPCGQLDPTVDHLYDILEDIYSEMYPAFQSPDLFHMGGDEVSVSCWNSSERIRNWMLKKGWRLEEDDFMRLWGHFQDNALERLDRVTGRKLPIIMWTSRLTDIPYVEQYLDKARYIIQVIIMFITSLAFLGITAIIPCGLFQFTDLDDWLRYENPRSTQAWLQIDFIKLRCSVFRLWIRWMGSGWQQLVCTICWLGKSLQQ